MRIENEVKQELIWGDIRIRLFKSKKITEIPYNSVSNIIA